MKNLSIKKPAIRGPLPAPNPNLHPNLSPAGLGLRVRLGTVAVVCLSAISLHAQPLLFTTVAGYPGKGSSDGIGSGALFNGPQGVAVDSGGNVYVADTGNNTIRRVSSGISTTIAGQPGVAGSVDGTGTNALFNQPSGIAVDTASNVYVTEFGNHTVRKITRSGVVTTIAGTAGLAGSTNSNGTNALFFHPMGICVDSSTNLYVADYGNQLIRKISPTFAVSTLAGSVGVFGSANGTGTAAQFYNPEGVTVDSSGNVYVADTGNADIREITSGGVVSTIAGSPGSLGSADALGTNALFYQPTGVAITSSGILYISDYFNNTVRQMVSGYVTTVAGAPGAVGSADGQGSSARFYSPQYLAVDSSGKVYVADTGNSAIRVMTTGYAVTTLAGSASEGSVNGSVSAARFYSPQNLAVDKGTNIYIADTQNSVIRKITPGEVVSLYAGSVGVAGYNNGSGSNALFSAPQGVAVDPSGNVFVADTGNSVIREISSGGSVSLFAGSPGNPGNADGTNSTVQFYQPEGIAVDASDNVYVADTWNHTIRKITSAGVSSTLAGLAGTFGSFDGTNSGARFNCPTGVAVDGSGNLYVTDFNNNTIRKVTSAGVVTTIAGYAGSWGSSDGTNSGALFYGPAGIAVSGSGVLYVIDSGNNTVRKVVSSGSNWIVTTIAGMAGVSGSANGTGSGAQFFYPAGVCLDTAGYVYVADAGNNTIRSQGIPPSFLLQPMSQTNLAGTIATFNVSTYGSTPFTYIWQSNGTNYPPTSNSYLMTSNAGTYDVIVSNIAGQLTSAVATLTLTNPPTGSAGVFQNISVLGNGTVQFNLSGTSGATYTLQLSTNLNVWTNLATFTMTNGAIQFSDTNAAGSSHRFYKLASP